ncbi:MAG: alpha/beta fold hydrolase [Flavobacteriaceae bacterium]|nr:alpha/beta fold hydrolase [Flavobacteriaceae bacterium]
MKKKRKYNQGVVVPKALMLLIHFLEFLNPYWGMRLAAFFFSKPFRYKRPKREFPILSRAQRSTYLVQKLNKTVWCYHWSGKGPKIVLVHGWSSRATNFYEIIEKLILLDYNVYAFDAVAHGESKGIITNIPELIKTLEELIQEWGPVEAILGHSGGGFASAYVVAQNRQIKKLILISSFNKVTDVFKKYFEMIQLGEKARLLMLGYFTKLTGKKVQELSGELSAQAIRAKTLVIHDRNDKEVQVEDSIDIAKNLKNGQLILTEGLGHRRILRDEMVINELVNFLKP